MKKGIVSSGVVLTAVAGLFSFNSLKTSITGKVTPADGATIVWAINGSDTIGNSINAGTFSIEVKPGTYKLIIDAKDPYKDVQLENLEVKQDQSLDVGEIVLQP